MFGLIKNSHWLQTLAVRSLARVHPAIEHNLGKAEALKKAFFSCYLEAVPGDYVEFGVYEGTSFIAALECHRKYDAAEPPPRRFWGFDSFEAGFKYFDDKDRHPYFREGEFQSSYERTRRRVERAFAGRAEWRLTKGFFEETVAGKAPAELGIERVAVALIDCDLGAPARIALDFLAPALQSGSVIILDDYFAYKGRADSGVAGAFADFRRDHPELGFRRLLDYGHGGRGFILSEGGQPAD